MKSPGMLHLRRLSLLLAATLLLAGCAASDREAAARAGDIQKIRRRFRHPQA